MPSRPAYPRTKAETRKMLPVDSSRRVKCLYKPDQGTARVWQHERHLPRPGSAQPGWLWAAQGFKAIQDLRVSALLCTPILLEADLPSPFMTPRTCDVRPSLLHKLQGRLELQLFHPEPPGVWGIPQTGPRLEAGALHLAHSPDGDHVYIVCLARVEMQERCHIVRGHGCAHVPGDHSDAWEERERTGLTFGLKSPFPTPFSPRLPPRNLPGAEAVAAEAQPGHAHRVL